MSLESFYLFFNYPKMPSETQFQSVRFLVEILKYVFKEAEFLKLKNTPQAFIANSVRNRLWLDFKFK